MSSMISLNSEKETEPSLEFGTWHLLGAKKPHFCLFFAVTSSIVLRPMVTLHQSNHHEFSTRFIGHYLSTSIRYRKRLRFFFNCAAFNPLWLGARGDCCIDYFEQPQLIYPL